MKLPEKNRLEAFSDGVFAIIITLLVLEINPPEIEHPSTQILLAGLYALLPKFMAFVISFIIIAVYWVSHHTMFNQLKFVSGKIMWLNLFTLLPLCLLPFTTALVGDYYAVKIAVFIYSLHIFVIGVVYNLLRKMILSSRKLLINADVPEYHLKQNLNGTILNLLACIFAFIWLPAAYVLLIVSRLSFIVKQLRVKQ